MPVPARGFLAVAFASSNGAVEAVVEAHENGPGRHDARATNADRHGTTRVRGLAGEALEGIVRLRSGGSWKDSFPESDARAVADRSAAAASRGRAGLQA